MNKWKSIWAWMKANKWKVIVPIAVIAILAFAFWYGGNAPGSRGWTVDAPTVPTSAPAAPEESGTTEPTADSALPTESQQKETEGSTVPSETQMQPTEIAPTEPKPTAPKPTEPSATEPPETTAPETKPTEPKHICYVSISCATILDNMDLCNPDKAALIPSSGGILWQAEIEFTPGESVFDVLQRACRNYGIHMESEWTPMYNSAYVEGICNIYEFDVGEDSGWMYKVNGWFPNYGCSRYTVEAGDDIRWVYTCNLGADVGGGNALG